MPLFSNVCVYDSHAEINVSLTFLNFAVVVVVVDDTINIP